MRIFRDNANKIKNNMKKSTRSVFSLYQSVSLLIIFVISS